MAERPPLPPAIRLERGRPLIVCDADEVLFQFMRGFERFLGRTGEHRFEMKSFSITGNVLRNDNDEVVSGADVKALLDRFFAEDTRNLEPVAGAAQALSALSGDAQIVILSNLPAAQAGDRRHALVRHGMDYPLITHNGLKGPMVRTLTDEAAAPAVFIDDLPFQIDSVAEHSPDATCVHFVADERLALLVPAPLQPHQRARDWAHAQALIGQAIKR